MASFGKPRPGADQEARRTCRSTTARPDGYDFFLEMGPLPNADAKHFKGEIAVLERGDGARHLRRLLEGPQPPAAPQEHQAGGADRRRLVRRREPVRGAGDVQARRGERARRRATTLVMGPWVHGGWAAATATQLGDVAFNAKTARVLPRADRVAVLRVPPEGQGRRQAARRRGCSRPARTSGGSSTPGRRRSAKPRRSTSDADGELGSTPRADRGDERPTAFDEYVSDPAKPVPFIDKTGDRHGAAST